MIKMMCPACEEEKDRYELINVAAPLRMYEVRCPDCGKAFVVYGQDMEGRIPPAHREGTQNRKSGSVSE